jgi:bifunctional UDP-N-acetylglucosamine pyrophosphorylase/glucosamine-1-phosphate N-acetyltransferase
MGMAAEWVPPLSAIVLAGGAGARMRSDTPKPLHELAGRSMLLYVLDAVQACTPDRVVVVTGSGGDAVAKAGQEEGLGHIVRLVEQRVPRGTADAVSVALAAADDLAGIDDPLDEGDVLVVPGDVPLLPGELLVRLVAAHRTSGVAATLLTTSHGLRGDRSGYGRILRGGRDDAVRNVAQDEPGQTADGIADGIADGPVEIATGIGVYRRAFLAPGLRRVLPDAVTGELHLSDVVGVLTGTGHAVATLRADDAVVLRGVNDRRDLALAEAELRRRTNEAWMARGVRMVDPERTYVDTTVLLGADVTLQPGTMLGGRTVIGDGAEIGPDTRLVDCAVGSGARVVATTGADAEVGPRAVVGPYAVLEPGSEVPPGVVTGPFYAGRPAGS